MTAHSDSHKLINLVPTSAPARVRPVRTKPPGFYDNTIAALQLTLSRGRAYNRVTEGRSKGLTRILLAFDVTWFVCAALFEFFAHPFNCRGITIVRNDFVPVTKVGPLKKPPHYTKSAEPPTWRSLRKYLRQYRRASRLALLTGNFHKIAMLTYDALKFIEMLEVYSESLFAKHRYLLGMTGHLALNAIVYDRKSNGQTRLLSRVMLLVPMVMLRFASAVDRRAQKIHALGVGIVENDYPPIAFVKRWERRIIKRRSKAAKRRA